MDEWGIALVAFFGAIVGAVVGFIGLAWQHSAARDEDIRKVGAQLLYHGEAVRNGYLRYREMSLSQRGRSDQPQRISDSIDKVGELLRYLELVASKDLYAKVNRFVIETQSLATDIGPLAVHGDSLKELLERWFYARTSLAAALRFPGAKPVSWRVRELKKLLFHPN